jgi:hypothetical protein
MKAKVIINIASYNTSIFETHRMNHLLSIGKVIVSEMGANTSIAERYADGVILIPNEQDPKNISILFAVVCDLIQNETLLAKQSKKAQTFYQEAIFKQDIKVLIRSMVKTISYFANL